jgi:hypothetical protein
VAPKNIRVQLEERQWHSPLDAAVQLEHFDLHVGCVCQLRMLLAYGAKLDDFPRLGARRPRRPHWISHVAIIHNLNELRVPRAT